MDVNDRSYFKYQPITSVKIVPGDITQKFGDHMMIIYLSNSSQRSSLLEIW